MRSDIDFFNELRLRLTGHGRAGQGLLPGHFNTAFLVECICALELKKITHEPLTDLDRLAVHVMAATALGREVEQLRSDVELFNALRLGLTGHGRGRTGVAPRTFQHRVSRQLHSCS